MRIRPRGSGSGGAGSGGALAISPALVARVALGAFGVWVASIGFRALLRGHPFAANAPVGRWLIGGVLAHDAVIAPTVFVLGAITSRLAGPRVRQMLGAILLIGGSVLIVGLPDVLRKGHNANPTVTPLNYPRNLLIVLLAVVGGVVLTTVVPALRKRRRARRVAEPVEPVDAVEQAEPVEPPEPVGLPEPIEPAEADGADPHSDPDPEPSSKAAIPPAEADTAGA
jgi:hypothetical protein